MSKKLVRKLLQEQVWFEDELANASAETETRQDKKKKRKRGSNETTPKPRKKRDPIQAQVQSILRLDRAIAKRDMTSRKCIAQQSKLLHKVSKSRKRTKSIVDTQGIGNTRSSSSTLIVTAKQQQEPTFDRKRFELEKKQQTLRNIGLQLKKQLAKNKGPNGQQS